MAKLLLSAPVIITPRLLPGVQIGKAFISIEYAHHTADNRQAYRYYLDIGKRSHTGDDLASGCGGGSLQSGLESLLDFLGACGESVAYSDRGHGPGENVDLFPRWVGEWCAQNSDELAIMRCELEESAAPCIDEE